MHKHAPDANFTIKMPHIQPKIVRWLLRNGANPDASTLDGQCPLHLAVAHGHVEVVRALLEAGGLNVGAKAKSGATALLVTKAAGAGQEAFEACKGMIREQVRALIILVISYDDALYTFLGIVFLSLVGNFRVKT